VTALDLSHASPADLVVALRSFPRRFRAALAPIADDEQIEELAHRLGPDGRSAVDIASGTTRTWVLQREALRQILVGDQPLLHPAIADPTARDWSLPGPESVAEVLDLLTDEADQFAEALEHVSGAELERSGTVAGDGAITALQVAKEAVGTGHDDLAAVQALLAALRVR